MTYSSRQLIIAHRHIYDWQPTRCQRHRISTSRFSFVISVTFDVMANDEVSNDSQQSLVWAAMGSVRLEEIALLILFSSLLFSFVFFASSSSFLTCLVFFFQSLRFCLCFCLILFLQVFFCFCYFFSCKPSVSTLQESESWMWTVGTAL